MANAYIKRVGYKCNSVGLPEVPIGCTVIPVGTVLRDNTWLFEGAVVRLINERKVPVYFDSAFRLFVFPVSVIADLRRMFFVDYINFKKYQDDRRERITN